MMHLEAGRCFRKMLGPKAQIQKCWQALIIRGGSVGIKDYGYIIYIYTYVYIYLSH